MAASHSCRLYMERWNQFGWPELCCSRLCLLRPSWSTLLWLVSLPCDTSLNVVDHVTLSSLVPEILGVLVHSWIFGLSGLIPGHDDAPSHVASLLGGLDFVLDGTFVCRWDSGLVYAASCCCFVVEDR